MTPLYLDHNATTPLLPEVREAMVSALEGWGNPSSHHWAGRTARALLDAGRGDLAKAIGGEVSEIVFCSGASEADNLAIRGACSGRPGAKDTIVVTGVEHPAVRAAANECAERGWRVESVGVDSEGRLDVDALAKVLATGRVALVSVMAVNNETGVVFDVETIGRMTKDAGALFHCDAVQALGKIAVNVRTWNADLVCLTAHKCGGPKGIGALWIRRGVSVAPLIVGGSQEKDRRAGTENVAGVVGFGVAARLAAASQPTYAERMSPLRDRLEREIAARIPGATFHGRAATRVANTTYVSFEGTMGENLLLSLDLEGIAVSGGSACASGALHPSRTLEAMGVSAQAALGAVRFSFGWTNTSADIDRVMEVLPGLIARERRAA